jgi:hypothetical protein
MNLFHTFAAHCIFGSKIKEWWDRDQLLEDQVEPLIFVANTGESSSEFDSRIIFLFFYLFYYLFLTYFKRYM